MLFLCPGQLRGGGDTDAWVSTVSGSASAYDQAGPHSQSVLEYAAAAGTPCWLLSSGGEGCCVVVAIVV